MRFWIEGRPVLGEGRAFSARISPFRASFFILAACLLSANTGFGKPKNSPEPVMLVVMDPLAKELACACVTGYAQRDYRKLAARLEKALKQRVKIEFSDDLAESMAGTSPAQQVIVAGDESLVVHGAGKAGLKCHPVCRLTDADGNTSLGALFVARSDDPAKELQDIIGRKLLFGLPEEDAKHAASLTALRAPKVDPLKADHRGSFTDAVLDMLDSSLSPAPVAVIPAYGLRLIEGCGSVKPGSMKVIGKSEAVPFITVFVSDNFPAEKEGRALKTLLGMKSDARMLKSMESRDGFQPLKSQPSSCSSWPDWRGPGRDGHVAQLPARLPLTPKFVWKKGAMNGGLAGLSVSGERLLIAERDFDEQHDVYRCLDANNGATLWVVQFRARGKLDYGQFPRATPVIHGNKAYLLGAFGGLRCVNLADGKLVWERQLPAEFKAPLPAWGMCSTPLIVDDELIVNPGATKASLVALDCANGRTRWTTPGPAAAYSAFICAELGGQRQIIGYDRLSLGGWDVKTGKRLWKLIPPVDGDFNVPTPVAAQGGLVVATENNGTRFYRFDEFGRIISKPAAEFPDLSPTTASPVATCGRLFGACPGLHCLDLHHGLKAIWHLDDQAIGDHVSFIADNERVLVITMSGELILLDAKADTCTIISRLRLFDDGVDVYAHPALVGTRLYARGESSVVCVDLSTKEEKEL
jgi:outer membrane protein assembly factor BamB/ABC-type phosphate/phosphonate transport system substrate-binding protein